MKRTLMCCISTVVALSASQAQTTVIDFDDLPGGTLVTSQYHPHANFSSPEGCYVVVGGSFTSPPNVMRSGPNGSTGTADIFIDFPTPLRNLQFWGFGANSGGFAARFNLFENGVLTLTYDWPGFTEGGRHAEFFNRDQITRLEIVNITTPGGISWDDFVLDAVPEPASAVVLATSLLATLALRRRR